MSRKEIALETLRIQQQGYYEYDGQRIDFATAQKHSEDSSHLITPEQGAALVRDCHPLSKSPFIPLM
ncbi:hypothetical protein [Paenibacillus sp. UNC451MF]|uniref:hypothetical protein n=1 Tax=Paenibacillus sp. UNC451MF TaxID=1449063 RepID=UPI00055A84F8|nr:hypothetical protein [Paenibacillus sp. UNC451MF]